MSKKLRGQLFKLLYWVTLAFFVWLVYRNIEDYEALLATFQSANWTVIGYALLLAIGNQLIQAMMYRANFMVMSNVKEYPGYAREVLIAYFLGLTTPFGTAGGNAFLIAYLRRLGFSYLRAFFAIASSNLSFVLVFSVILSIGLRYLHLEHQLTNYQVSATAILAVLAGLIPITILSVLLLPQTSIRFAKLIVYFINWSTIKIFKKDIIDKRKVTKYAKEVMDMSDDFDNSLRKFIGTLKFSLLFHLINIFAFYLIFTAYGTPITVTALIIVYSITVLFSIISPTPQGIGVAEGLAHLGAISVGIPGAQSLTVILTYRLFTVWVPALLGAVLLRRKTHAIN